MFALQSKVSSSACMKSLPVPIPAEIVITNFARTYARVSIMLVCLSLDTRNAMHKGLNALMAAMNHAKPTTNWPSTIVLMSIMLAFHYSVSKLVSTGEPNASMRLANASTNYVKINASISIDTLLLSSAIKKPSISETNVQPPATKSVPLRTNCV